MENFGCYTKKKEESNGGGVGEIVFTVHTRITTVQNGGLQEERALLHICTELKGRE